MPKKIIKVHSITEFEFWVNMFKPRTKKYQRETLRRLKKQQSIFETTKQREDKIKALNFLLGRA